MKERDWNLSYVNTCSDFYLAIGRATKEINITYKMRKIGAINFVSNLLNYLYDYKLILIFIWFLFNFA